MSVFVADVLAGQVALVTGGATGIGKEICRVLGRHGARIAITSRRQEVLDAAAVQLREEGIDVHVESCDVRDAVGVERVVAGVVERYERLDIVVNNAAGNFPAPISGISPNGFKAVVDIDLLGTFNVTKAAFEKWLQQHGGSVVNITAPFEGMGAAFQSHVAAAKAGVDSFTRTCAVEWGRRRDPPRHRGGYDPRGGRSRARAPRHHVAGRNLTYPAPLRSKWGGVTAHQDPASGCPLRLPRRRR